MIEFLQKIFIISISSLYISGCSISGTSYPKHWASIDSSLTEDECPKLEGTYSNHGTEVFPAEIGEPKSLSDVFALMGRSVDAKWDVPSEAISISIGQAPETLTITFIEENGKQTSVNFRKEQFWPPKLFDLHTKYLFHCPKKYNEPRLRFLIDVDPHTMGIYGLYLGWEAVIVSLLKATDGSLIVRWTTESGSMSSVIIGSHYSNDSIWLRYSPLEKAQ